MHIINYKLYLTCIGIQWYGVERVVYGSNVQRRDRTDQWVGVPGAGAAGGGGGEASAEKHEHGGAAVGRHHSLGVAERRPPVGLRDRREQGERLQPLVPRRRARHLESTAVWDSPYQTKIKDITLLHPFYNLLLSYSFPFSSFY